MLRWHSRKKRWGPILDVSEWVPPVDSGKGPGLDVCNWHFADIAANSEHVRFRG